MKIRVLLQARMGSSRLPGKAMKTICGKTLTLLCMEALGTVSELDPVLVTDEASGGVLKTQAALAGWKTFVGSPDNVLDRYARGSAAFPSDLIIRATGDNPLVSAQAALYLIEQFKQYQADFMALDLLPLGTGVELFTSQALERAALSPDPFDQEHVGPAFYRHPDRFTILRLPAPKPWQFEKARVTVDTLEDYEYIEKLMNHLYKGSPLTLEEILPWLEKHPR